MTTMIEYSFLDVCRQNFEGIEIPLIQRDYAQGRIQESKKRGRFLQALHSAIQGNGISLDFIYGSLTADNKLVPLDGQQRLTTLFLLHWYAVKRGHVAEEEWKCLTKFTYTARFNARRFCEHLLAYDPDFNSRQAVSAQIRNEAWFASAWDEDPTVASMLQMLDDIALTFADTENLWDELCQQKKITFCFNTLEDMGITDDIYIKMNSRGKPLTDFEHFKAELTNTIKREDLSMKIDRDWTNLLWPYRGANNIIDEEFLAYFHFITDIICFKTGRDIIRSEQEIGLGNDYFEMIRIYQDKKNVELLEKYFDCWCHIKDIDAYLKSYLANSEYEISKVKVYDWPTNLFKDCCENYKGAGRRGSLFNNNKIIMLYAFILRNTKGKDIDDHIFRRRLRILRNLVWNSTYELRTERIRALLEEAELIILQGQVLASREDNGFNRLQKEEEIKKITWCELNPALTEQLFQLEDHELLYGCIAIADLESSDSIEKIRALLNLDLKILGRALLTYDDYSQTINNYKQLSNGTTHVWQQLFHPSIQRNGFENTKKTIALLLSDCDEISNEKLSERIENYLNAKETAKDWRYYFVKYPCILVKPDNGKYHWKNSYEINVIRANTYRGHYWDAISLAIYDSYDGIKELMLDNWGRPLTLAFGNRLLNKQEYLEIEDSEGNLIHKEPIPQTNGIDNCDRITLALQLIEHYITLRQHEG